jgi:hypothetical protein
MWFVSLVQSPFCVFSKSNNLFGVAFIIRVGVSSRAGRNSDQSTSSSATLLRSKSAQPDKTSESDSSKSAHCLGYIQGICPHLEEYIYLHPEDFMPCASTPRKQNVLVDRLYVHVSQLSSTPPACPGIDAAIPPNTARSKSSGQQAQHRAA